MLGPADNVLVDSTETDYIRAEPFADVMHRYSLGLRLESNLHRMKPGEVRDLHLMRVGDLLAVHHAELQRRADLAESARDCARQG